MLLVYMCIIILLILTVSTTSNSVVVAMFSLVAIYIRSLIPHAWAFRTHFLYEVVYMLRIVCLLLQYISTSSDSPYQYLSLLILTDFNAFLYDIVPIPILHHLIKHSILINCRILIART